MLNLLINVTVKSHRNKVQRFAWHPCPSVEEKNILFLNLSKAREKCLFLSVRHIFMSPSRLCHLNKNPLVLHRAFFSTLPPYWSEAPSSAELDQNHLTPHRHPPRCRPSHWCHRCLSVWTSTTAAWPLCRWGEAAQHRWLLQEVRINNTAHMSSATVSFI